MTAKVAHLVAGMFRIRRTLEWRIVASGCKRFRGCSKRKDGPCLPFLGTLEECIYREKDLIQILEKQEIMKKPRPLSYGLGVLVNRVLGCRETFSFSVVKHGGISQARQAWRVDEAYGANEPKSFISGI